MSMADCPKCWDVLCTCGYEYRNMPLSRRIEIASASLGIDPEELWNIHAADCIIPNEHPMKGEK